MAQSITASLVERLKGEKELTRLIFAILDPQLPDDLIANIRARLDEMIKDTPVVAWMYEDDSGVLVAQARDQEAAAAIFDTMIGDVADYDHVMRCKAMDGLGDNRLHGIYVNLWDIAMCSEFASCGTWVMPDDNGRLINADTRGEAIVVGDTLYCSRFCADHA